VRTYYLDSFEFSKETQYEVQSWSDSTTLNDTEKVLSMNRWNHRWQLWLASLLLCGCSLSGKQSTIVADGPVAQLQYETFLVTLWVSLAIFAVVGGLFFYCVIKFRAPGGDVAADYPLPDQGHGNPLIEIGVILVSILLVGVVAVPSVYGVLYSGTVPMGQQPLIIKVTGFQWWWKFEYPDLGVVTGNEAVIPVGRPVKFHVQTADVLHSFWVPRLGGKMDLTPGQDNWLWLQADRPGNYWGQCTEFCGESHAFMRFRVIAKEEREFEQWAAAEKKGVVNEQWPKSLSTNQCGICHSIRGVPGAQGLVGPDLTHIGSRSTIAAGLLDNTEENLKDWLKRPNFHKPGNTMYKAGYQAMKIEITDEEASELAKYLMTLK